PDQIQNAAGTITGSFGFQNIHAKAGERPTDGGEHSWLVARNNGQKISARLACDFDRDALALSLLLQLEMTRNLLPGVYPQITCREAFKKCSQARRVLLIRFLTR